jgi:hypothetical protein
MPTETPSDEQDDWNTPGMDPYADWALGAGRRYFFLPGRQQDLMPVLLQLRNISVQAFAEGKFIKGAQRRKRWLDSVHVSPLDIEFQAGADDSPFFATLVREDFFRLVTSVKELRDVVESVTLGLPLDSDSLPPPERKTARRKAQP